MRAKTIIISFMTIHLLALAGTCWAESGVRTALRQAESASKATPIEIAIATPFDATQAKTALKPGNHSVSGVLYHRLGIAGRDTTWGTPDGNPKPVEGVIVNLVPESAHVAEYVRQYEKQRKIVGKWYQGNAFVKQPQTKNFVLSPEAARHSLTATTDRFGRYRFENLRPGRYYLIAWCWQTGSYNKSVHAGTSEYSDGTGIHGHRGTIDHTTLERVDYKTHLVYYDLVKSSSDEALIDSRLRVDYNRMSVEYDK